VLFSLEIDREEKAVQKKVKEFFRVLNPDSPSQKKWWRKSFFFDSKPRGHLFRTISHDRLPLFSSLFIRRERKKPFGIKRFPALKERETFFFFIATRSSGL